MTEAEQRLELTGQKIRTLRKTCGITIKELAPMLGYNERHFLRIETGEYPVPAEIGPKLQRCLLSLVDGRRRLVSDDQALN